MSGSQEYTRLWRALVSLEGLAVGDAFGERFFSFSPARYHHYFEGRVLPPTETGSWNYTDDTQMALSLVDTLRRFQTVNQDYLIESFADHYEPARAYGPGMHALLRALRAAKNGNTAGPGGEHAEKTVAASSPARLAWRELAAKQFQGQGSSGNGAAMRVAPLGAYFATNLRRVVSQARISASVTHTHPEGIAGTIAVAIAAALAWQYNVRKQRPTSAEFIEAVLPFVPASTVRNNLILARAIPPGTSTPTVAALLGSGYQVSAQDTVPFVLWCAGQFLENYEEALWQTSTGLGDVDTTCAMVGGIVVLYTGLEQVPPAWLELREALPTWVLREPQEQKPPMSR